MTYHYASFEPGLWTVGTGAVGIDWEPESDHASARDAAARVRWLNGGPDESAAPADGRAERYRIAWHQARQRAQNHLAALIEADAERDALRAALRDRDDEVADLVVRLADFSGITS
jgi:hypothetical protein